MVNLPPPEPEDRQPSRPLRDNDEAIAIAIAFLSVGTILWWGWTRGQEFFGPVVNLPGLPGTTAIEEEGRSAPDAAADEQEQFLPFFFEDDREADVDEREARSAVSTERDAAAESRDRRDGDLPAAVAAPVPAATADPAPEADTSTVTEEATPSDEAAESGAEPLPELDISDVSEDYWAYPYIVSLYEADLLPNLPTGQLQPDKELTRAEMAALLNSSFVGEEPSQRSLNFTDVTADYWAADAVKQVVDAGYMTGFPDETFKPNELVPRYQVWITMASGLGLTPPANVDETLNQFQGAQDLPDWARPQVAAAAAAGLIVNHPDPQQLAPQQPATRAELIAIIHQALAARERVEAIETPFAIPAQ